MTPKTIADALDRNFTSPNVADRNLEPANVVDALAAIAGAINRLADAVERGAVRSAMLMDGGSAAPGQVNLTDAVFSVANEIALSAERRFAR